MNTWQPNFILSLLQQSHKLIRDIQQSCQKQTDARWRLKEDGSLLTNVDPANEVFLKNELTKDGAYFIGEETIEREGVDYVQKALEGVTWVVDPIDGTAPFAHNLPLWGVSVGMMEHGILKNGAVLLPDLDILLITFGDKVLYLRNYMDATDLSRATEIKPQKDEWDPGKLITLGQLITKIGAIKLPNPVLTSGSAVQALSWMIIGNAIGYIGTMKLWDIGGLLPMLSRLGYRAEFFGGDELTTDIHKNDAFCLDTSSPNCWKLKDTFFCSTPKIIAKMRQATSLL